LWTRLGRCGFLFRGLGFYGLGFGWFWSFFDFF
jgi:hypothetical protein